MIYLNSKWSSLGQVDAEVLAAKTAMKAKEAIMAGATARKVVQINRIEIQGQGIKRNRNVITTKRNLVIPTQDQIEAINQNQRKPLNHQEEEETTVGIVQEAVTEDSTVTRFGKLLVIWH